MTTDYVEEVFKFQLTRLMRGVTFTTFGAFAYHEFQLTRLMRGVTSARCFMRYANINFNSHASCEA